MTMTVFDTYNLSLAVLPLINAILIAYAIFDLASQLEELPRPAGGIWLVAGALATGIGLWIFQLLGMQIFHGIFLTQGDWTAPPYSLVFTIAAAAMALLILSRKTLSVTASTLGSIFFAAPFLLSF